MATVAWRAGVPNKLQRQGYSRKAEDIVDRLRPDTGPPMRRLMDGSAGQTVSGVLSLTPDQADAFDDWRLNDLDRGMASFDWVITDNGRAVAARFASQPKRSRTASRWHYELEIGCAAPEPVPGALAALAALEDTGPAVWPAGVPFRPKRTGFAAQPVDQVLRSPENGPQVQSLSSRAEGHRLDIPLHLTGAEVALFEAWFETEAGFGACDVRFPRIDGGTHLGCFDGAYTISPAPTAKWVVQFPVYLEAIA